MSKTKTDFSHNEVKRIVQRMLFNDIHCNCILGLAGPHPEIYKEILSNHCKKMILCDYNPAASYVEGNSLVGSFDIHKNEISCVDFDACTNIHSNIDDLKYIVNKARNLNSEVTILFNFSLRGSNSTGGLNVALDTLSEIFNTDFKKLSIIEIRQYPPTKKYIRIYESTDTIQLFQYRDSGNHMLSGKVIIKPRIKPEPKIKYKTASQRLNELIEFTNKHHRIPGCNTEGSLYYWCKYALSNTDNPKYKSIIDKIIEIKTKYSKK